MKKRDFDNRLQNDLFPEMPASFGRKLTKVMENEGVKIKKRPTATGIFAGAVSVVAAAAVLLIVLLGVLGGGKSQKNAAASQAPTVRMAQPTPGDWKGDTKVIALSESFDFENREKYEALYQGVLRFLSFQGESEPDELWLCAIKNRFVKEDTGNRADGYLSGYYVLAQHAFVEGDGPELYCLSDDFEVLWATEGSVFGPNHAVNPEKDSYAGDYQRHFLYGTEPMIAEPGVPHVKRGALVGKEPGTDIEFSMAASITEVQSRLSAADSAYPGAAREYFLMTVLASSWDQVMAAHTLRFETEEGPVDVDMEKELPTVGTVRNIERPQPTPIAEAQGVEYWLSQNQPLIRDFTDDWYGEEIVQKYGRAIARALRTSGEHISDEGIWVCGVFFCVEHEAGTPPENAFVLAQYAFDGEQSPELFYYKDGAIEWMTKGAAADRINVVYLDGSWFGVRTIAFCKSPAYDGGPLAASKAAMNVKNYAICELEPELSLSKIRQRVTGGPNYDAARECFLFLVSEVSEDESDGVQEIRELTVTALKDGRTRRFTLDKVNVMEPQTVPAMAVETGGVVYPGKVTHFAYGLDENGVAADGAPLTETLRGTAFEEIRIIRKRDGALPWEILTASDDVTADRVEVYSENLERLYTNAEIGIIDELPAGRYYLCFRTTIVGPYSEKIGRYTYRTDYTIYKAVLN